MMIIRQTRDIPTDNNLWEYLNKNNIEYTFHTYYNTTLTVYKIYTDSEDHLKNIDKILEEKNNEWKINFKWVKNNE